MNQLRAFVGHSFTEEDQEVVRAFLDFFNHVKELGIGFDWDHAKPAEPKALAEKVKQLTQDKNLFIGICTKKEFVIEPSKLKRGILHMRSVKVNEKEFSWKASDWIIQEIGLCIGKAMTIVLLVEEGLRQPGGLQGDLEYIPFNRTSPEKSFSKILEMITALIPTAIGPAVPAESSSRTDKEQSQTEATRQQEETLIDWLEPKRDWTREDFKTGLMRAIAVENNDAEQKIFQAFLSSPAAEREESRNGWEAAREYFRLLMGKNGTLGNLQAMGKGNPKNSEVQYYLAKGYQTYDEFDKAAEAFQHAAQHALTEKLRLSRLGDSAIALAKANHIAQSYAIIPEMTKIIDNVEDGKANVLRVIKQIAEIEKNDDKYLGTTEALINIYPDDNDMRFELAYRYSNLNREDLALYHYTRIPLNERNKGTWNNIGVANARLDLYSKAVEAYKTSGEKGGTLAMSNLSNKFIDSGFLSEAEELCERAIKIENYDKEIGKTISRIKDVQEDENKKQDKVLIDTRQYRDFYKDFGLASVKPIPNIPKTTWQGPRCTLDLEIKEGKLKAEGSYMVRSLNALTANLSGWTGVLAPPENTKYVVRYEGPVTGFAVKCQLTIEGDEPAIKMTTFLTELSKAKEALMVISDGLDKIQVYEKDAPERSRFYLLNRIES